MSETANAPVVGRRRLLLGTAGLAGGWALGVGPGARSAGARSRQQAPAPPPAAPPQVWTGAVSANGWPVVGDVPSHPIEGTDAEVALLDGDVAEVLLHVARRVSYEIGTLRPDEVTGHRTDRTVAAPFESNLLSGTALTIRQPLYPVGATGGFFPLELVVVRDALADCEGVVRWGGDLDPVKESHVQIDVAPGGADLPRVAAKIRRWNAEAAAGAGATDPFTAGRRRAASALERVQSS